MAGGSAQGEGFGPAHQEEEMLWRQVSSVFTRWGDGVSSVKGPVESSLHVSETRVSNRESNSDIQQLVVAATFLTFPP